MNTFEWIFGISSFLSFIGMIIIYIFQTIKSKKDFKKLVEYNETTLRNLKETHENTIANIIDSNSKLRDAQYVISNEECITKIFDHLTNYFNYYEQYVERVQEIKPMEGSNGYYILDHRETNYFFLNAIFYIDKYLKNTNMAVYLNKYALMLQLKSLLINFNQFFRQICLITESEKQKIQFSGHEYKYSYSSNVLGILKILLFEDDQKILPFTLLKLEENIDILIQLPTSYCINSGNALILHIRDGVTRSFELYTGDINNNSLTFSKYDK